MVKIISINFTFLKKKKKITSQYEGVSLLAIGEGQKKSLLNNEKAYFYFFTEY